MAKTNAELQQAYRDRHLKDFDSDNARIDLVVSGAAKRALVRMARQSGVTQRTMIETVLIAAEAALVGSMDAPGQDAYYRTKPNKIITG